MLESLGIDWKLLLFQIANFLLLLFILKKVLYKPLLGFLEARRKKIEEALEKSDKLEEEWQKMKALQREKMSEIEKEASLIVEKARSDAEKKEKEILLATQEKSEKIMEEARQDISREKDKILAEVKKEAADYVVFAAERILKRTINEQDEKELIKETLDAIRKK